MKLLKNDERKANVGDEIEAICPHCFKTDAVYNSIVADYRCQICGNWFMGENIADK